MQEDEEEELESDLGSEGMGDRRRYCCRYAFVVRSIQRCVLLGHPFHYATGSVILYSGWTGFTLYSMAQEASDVLTMTHIRVTYLCLNNKFDIVNLKLAFVFQKKGSF